MTDREKVIKGIGICLDRLLCDADCPYYDLNTGCREQLRDDTLTLLKEQEPVKPNKPGTAYKTTWSCGVCSYPISTDWVACPSCGKPVKWE